MSAAYIATVLMTLASSCQEKIMLRVLALRKTRSAEISLLMLAVKNGIATYSGPDAAAAIRMLGIYRATEAVPLLIEHIDYSTLSFATERPFSCSESQPCAFVLGQIGGKKCHDSLIRLASVSDNDEIRRCVRMVLETSLGYDDAVALLASRIEREKDSKKVDRLLTFKNDFEQRERNTIYK